MKKPIPFKIRRPIYRDTILVGILCGILYILLKEYFYFVLRESIIACWLPDFLSIYSYVLPLFVLIPLFFHLKGRNLRRGDILLAFFTGFFSSLVFSSLWSDLFHKGVQAWELNKYHLTIIVALPFLPFIINDFYKSKAMGSKQKATNSRLLDDGPKQDQTEDALGFKEKAESFAKMVHNENSPKSFSFGINAPWGSGKTTFLNFCKPYWKENKHIIFQFSPLPHDNQTNLLHKFVDGLTTTINKTQYIPELIPATSKYRNILKGASFSLFGCQLPIPIQNMTTPEVLKSIQYALDSLEGRIIIIVDDLDRLDLSTIRSLVFTIRNFFNLKKISYIFCYDMANITRLERQEGTSRDISEFLDKYINTCFNLILDKDLLLKYLKSFTQQKQKELLSVDITLLGFLIKGLEDIFDSNEWLQYAPLLENLRKDKQLINAALLLSQDGIAHERIGFDPGDFIHLLLLYIHFPQTYRDIYRMEVKENQGNQGNQGFFSFIEKDLTSNATKKWEHSEWHKEYLKRADSQCAFLLNKIFPAVVTDDHTVVLKGGATLVRQNAAYFNTQRKAGIVRGTGNLKYYLQLLENRKIPPDSDVLKFYTNKKNAIYAKQISIQDVLEKDKIFGLQKEENQANHVSLWNSLVNNAQDMPPEIAKELITYSFKNAFRYPSFTEKASTISPRFECIRKESLFAGTAILNETGWKTSSHDRNNSNEKVLKIAHWIFGEGNEYLDSGILPIFIKKLEEEESPKKILVLDDLLFFRLWCAANYGSFFNIHKGLALYKNTAPITTGDTTKMTIEGLRILSQTIFSLFREHYINKEINIFSEIERLSLPDVSGLMKLEENHTENVQKQLIGFIPYQLGSAKINLGVPCGYYDAEGTEDKHGIQKEMAQYLIQTCFNTEKDENKRHFFDYLLRLVGNQFEYSPPNRDIPKDMLCAYWSKNKATLLEMSLELIRKKEQVKITNTPLHYEKGLPSLIQSLNTLTS